MNINMANDLLNEEELYLRVKHYAQHRNYCAVRNIQRAFSISKDRSAAFLKRLQKEGILSKTQEDVVPMRGYRVLIKDCSDFYA